jgi:uncharacterized protein (DUF1330 family)
MPAYVIFLREKPIHNQAEIDIYTNSGRERPVDPKLKPLVVYGAMQAIEGEPADGVVILEFPTMDDAKNWYYSPAYQAAAVHRRNGAEYRGMIVEGF